MNFDRRRDVNIIVGDPNRGMRALYRTALRSEGFEAVHGFETLEGFAKLLKQVQPDLIFMNVAMPGGDAIALTQAIRHGQIGNNPFVPIILATWEPEHSTVRRIIDAGADDLLVKPLSTQAITDRIQALAERRKPFVVTADYIGPDRRSGKRSDNDGPLLVVPNGLRAKLEGLPTDGEDFRKDIARMQEQINTLRLKASAFRIAFVAAQLDTICRSLAGERNDAEMLLNGLIMSVEDVRLRIGERDRNTIVTLCDYLAGAVKGMLASDPPSSPKAWLGQIGGMQSKAAALLQYFNPDLGADQLKAQIEAAVNRFRARMAAIASGALPTDGRQN